MTKNLCLLPNQLNKILNSKNSFPKYVSQFCLNLKNYEQFKHPFSDNIFNNSLTNSFINIFGKKKEFKAFQELVFLSNFDSTISQPKFHSFQFYLNNFISECTIWNKYSRILGIGYHTFSKIAMERSVVDCTIRLKSSFYSLDQQPNYIQKAKSLKHKKVRKMALSKNITSQNFYNCNFSKSVCFQTFKLELNNFNLNKRGFQTHQTLLILNPIYKVNLFKQIKNSYLQKNQTFKKRKKKKRIFYCI